MEEDEEDFLPLECVAEHKTAVGGKDPGALLPADDLIRV